MPNTGGEYDLSGELISPDGKRKLVPTDSAGGEMGGFDVTLDYVSFALRMVPTQDLQEAVSMMVTADRVAGYKGTEKASAVPLSNDNIKNIKSAVLKVFNKFVLFRVMQIIDPSGLKE